MYTNHFPNISVGKESTCNAGDPGLIPGSGRFPEEGIGYSLQYSWASLVSQLVKNLPCNMGGLGLIPIILKCKIILNYCHYNFKI